MSNLPGPITRFRYNNLLNGLPGKDGAEGPQGPAGPAGGAASQQTNTLANGLNSNVPTGGESTIRVQGPTAAFSVGGFNTGGTPLAGTRFVVINTTAQPMTIVHEDASSTAANRIDTGSGGPVTLPPRRGRVTFTYDGVSARWVLENGGINYQKWIDVRDFGAIGDGVADDTAACQAALTYARSLTTQFAGVLQPAGQFPGTQGWVAPTVYFPRGVYKLSASSGQACLEVGEAIHVLGDGVNTILQPTTTSAHIIRHANLYQRFDDLNFVGGNSAIVSNGPSRYYGGQLGSPDYNGTNIINNCWFSAQAGPSYYTDVTLHPTIPTSGVVLFEGCFIITSCAFLGAPDNVTFRKCYLWCVQAPLGGPQNGFCPVVNDDSGNLLGFITCYTLAVLDHCIGVPLSDDTRTPKGSWLQGTGIFRSVGTRFGGESQLVIAKSKTNTTYRSINWGTIAPVTRATWEFEGCAMPSAFAHNWLEIYDSFPLVISVGPTPPSVPTAAAEPEAPYLLMGSNGIWVDSVSCPTSTFLGTWSENIAIHIDPRPSGFDFRFRTSNDPSLTLGHLGVTDITPLLRKHFTGESKVSPPPPLGEAINLWPAGVLQASQANTAAGTVTTGGTDSSRGYTIQGFHTTPTNGSFLNVGFDNVFTSSLPHGEYTVSFMIKSAVAGRVLVCTTDATGAANPVIHEPMDFAGGDWQRLETVVYWNGSTFSGSTGQGVQFQFPVMPQSQDFYLAFFALHPGQGARPWTFPGNNTANALLVETYYAPSSPTSGTYKLGDTIWNTNANAAGQPAGWRCIRAGAFGGAAGTAPIFAPISYLAFDPSEIASYNVDYDAASLTPGAITLWPSKYGGTDTAPRFGVSGTATAHAAGGTGPNGAAYVSGNGSSDGLTEDNQSSQSIIKELFLVAKYDTTGGGSGTLWDGGVINSGRIYRPGVNQVELVLSGPLGPFSTPAGATEQWAIWHVIADGTNGEMDIGGVNIIPTQSYPTSFFNGVTMFANGGGGSGFAQASIARAIGFSSALTTAERAQMFTYLQNLYGLATGGPATANEAFQKIASGIVITGGTIGIVATVTLTAGASGMVEVVGSAGPGGQTQTGWTSQNLTIFYNTAGGGIVATNAVAGEPMNNTGAALFAGTSAIISNLTPGTSYDFYLCETPTGGDFHTSGSPNQSGGIYGRAL